ncbi:hypothetical protein TPHA_0C03250 [Tetrapisispora phaffii CBS 4417]|uniref:6-phosphofructo-2-kinase domain-containing protein n=1 Tax=Tetrapisispora phaffii (strain ATCC 24235 / CBS 4417 / NBRC 1672 / NRRL Y-8282 / UCD 70-5) TaxID=1071381 RepID=G8BRV2_TETPH|nr:hypothetical protein TPHA_0C03250 [Tetrapisispora phaffii CBS 4417]CCE62478.1 hypothetical protein TPHA_0C03250 [Tetrapisispora phaffii CBS 4417]
MDFTPKNTPLQTPFTSDVNINQIQSQTQPHTHTQTQNQVDNNKINKLKLKVKDKNVNYRSSSFDIPGLTKSKKSPYGLLTNDDIEKKLIIVMCGLPASGKSFITNKLSRYLNFMMFNCKAFNVGNTRRTFSKENKLEEQTSDFFNANNEKYLQLRDKWALDTLEELLNYLLVKDGAVAIFDATNTTKERRRLLFQQIKNRSNKINVVFLETICSNEELTKKNIKLKISGPDYIYKDPVDSLIDFEERLKNYKKVYESIEDSENLSYIKMIDVGEKIITYKLNGFLTSETLYYLMNFNLNERKIWITRNGESKYNLEVKMGGDSYLTKRGKKYSKALKNFIDDQKLIEQNNYKIKSDETQKKEYLRMIERYGENNITIDTNNEVEEVEEEENDEFHIWSSMRKRAIESVQYFDENKYQIKQIRMLDEINAGDFDSLSHSDFKEYYPIEFEKKQNDTLRYKYPGNGGESYLDVINRLRTVINEIERLKDSVLIVTHPVPARVLLGYFLNISKDIIADIDIPLHCVYCLDIKPYGISWSLYEYVEKLDTFVQLPQNSINTTKVKEVGLVYKEKHYSEIPTKLARTLSNENNCSSLIHRSVSFDSLVDLPMSPNVNKYIIKKNKHLHTMPLSRKPFTKDDFEYLK